MTWLVNGNLIDVRDGRIERRNLQVGAGRVTTIATALPAKTDGAAMKDGRVAKHVH
jgi:hypothetical protein